MSKATTCAKMGRPTAYTPEAGRKILTAIRKGLPMEMAGARAGVRNATFYSWVARGAKALRAEQERGIPIPEADRPYVDFSLDVEEATADYTANRLGVIQRHERTQWTAAAWQLERRFPQLFGRQDRHYHSHQLQVEAGMPGPAVEMIEATVEPAAIPESAGPDGSGGADGQE